MKLAAYEIIKNSPTRFSIKYTRSLQVWFVSLFATVAALLAFLLLHGFNPLTVIACLLVFPVVIILMELANSRIPFSITVDPNKIVIVRKRLGVFSRESSIEKSSILAMTAKLRRLGRFSIFYQGSLEVMTQDQKKFAIFFVTHSGRDAIAKEIQFMADTISKVLSLPVNMEQFTYGEKPLRAT